MNDTHSSRELKILLDAHESRDNERFEEGRRNIQESLDDVSTAIQAASKSLMSEMKPIRDMVMETKMEIRDMKTKMGNLELINASQDGSRKWALGVGIFCATIAVGYMGWIGTQVVGMKTDIQSLKGTLQAYNIQIK